MAATEDLERAQDITDRLAVTEEAEEITQLISSGHEHEAMEKFSGSPVLDAIISQIIKEAE